jgi:TolA-binding protein
MNRVGRLRTRNRAFVVLAVSLLAVTCHKSPPRTTAPASAPPQTAVPVPPPPASVPATRPKPPLPASKLPAPPEPPLPEDLRDAEAHFQSGRYAEAARAYNQYLREEPIVQFRDLAMFKMGMAQALACATSDCRAKSQEQFKRLVSLFPQSPYSAEARFILGLQNEIERAKLDAKAHDEKIKKLTDELERLKKIDLERKSTPIKK